jgi:hypothetical protein
LLFNKSPDITAAITLMNSPEYKKTEFNFIFIGSDESISAFGDLIQYMYQSGDKNSPLAKLSPDETTKEVLKLFGNLSISIRKDFGNEKTKLRGRDTLKLFITDLYKHQDL